MCFQRTHWQSPERSLLILISCLVWGFVTHLNIELEDWKPWWTQTLSARRDLGLRLIKEGQSEATVNLKKFVCFEVSLASSRASTPDTQIQRVPNNVSNRHYLKDWITHPPPFLKLRNQGGGAALGFLSHTCFLKSLRDIPSKYLGLFPPFIKLGKTPQRSSRPQSTQKTTQGPLLTIFFSFLMLTAE